MFEKKKINLQKQNWEGYFKTHFLKDRLPSYKSINLK